MANAKRQFIQVSPELRDRSGQPRGEIDSFFQNHIFVVLGEPGLGKTTSFQHAAEIEENAEFVRIGEFLSSPDLDHWLGKTLYLDGLDEHRSRANGIDVMDAIIGRLKSLGNPQARISCRTAEWHGGKDLDSLSAVSNGTAVVQLELQPLKPDDIIALVPDGEEFVAGARANGLDEFLTNPQDFFLLHQFYQQKNTWPDNRTALMEGACKALLKELNKDHYDAVDDWVSDKGLTNASDYLAAILLLSNVSGIACDRIHSDRMFPAIHEFEGDLFAMKVAVGRHVFKAAEKNRIEPKHRKIAEYMAARYLASRVRQGLSLRRVIALITGVDGGTAPDLRGVYAWLATMLSGMADHIFEHDPYGALIYGDTKAWTPNSKRCALLALERLSEKDPWFRGGDWSRSELGGLSDTALVEEFERILVNDACKSHLVSTILDAIAGGPELPELGDLLLAFVRNPNKPDHLKSEAIDAFANSCPSRIAELEVLLQELQTNKLSDADDYIRGSILKLLYPNVIGPDRVLQYLKKPSDGVIGWYHVFFSSEILELTPREGLKVLADNLDDLDPAAKDQHDYSYRSLLSRLIRLLIENFGQDASNETLLSWLTLGTDQYESNRLDQEEIKPIRDFLSAHDNKYVELFFTYIDHKWTKEKIWHQIWWRFLQVVAQVPPPASFPRRLLARVENEPSDEIKATLYSLACFITVNQEPGLSTLTYDDLIDAAGDSEDLRSVLEQMSVCDIEEWRQEQAERNTKREEELRTRQARNIENLGPRKEELATGKALDVLEHYARVWFGLFTDVDGEASPLQRIRTELGDQLAQACVEGFRNALTQPVFHSVEEIGRIQIESKYFYRGFLMLAGMDVVAADGRNQVFGLPDDVLRAAIAYEESSALGRKPEWPRWLDEHKPEIVSSALNEYWRVQFETDPERIFGFHTFNENEPRLQIIVELLPGLLADFPTAQPTLLESMLTNAVLYSDSGDILPLIEAALRNQYRPGSGQRAMWMATGFVFSPNEYHERLKSQLSSNESDKWAVFPIVMARIWDRDAKGRLISSREYRKQTIEILGAVFDNVHYEYSESGFIGSRDAASNANDLRKLIHSFAEDPSTEAAIILADLHEDAALSRWKSDLLYTIANQIRTARAANFTFPDVSEVVSTLSNAEPANAADLKALVVDSLKEIAEEIRHGNTDGYKTFWNIKGGKATDIHVDENTARDRLLEYLRPKLRHLDVIAEPEVRYADEKRADIAVYSRGMKLPIEIKRDDHQEIWSAIEHQLERRYTRDPASEGNGVYLVFWLDGKDMKKPPAGIKKPEDASELEKSLRITIPESSAGLIDIVVIDASVPVGKLAKKRATKKKVKKAQTKKKSNKNVPKKASKKAKKKSKASSATKTKRKKQRRKP